MLNYPDFSLQYTFSCRNILMADRENSEKIISQIDTVMFYHVFPMTLLAD
jgi:hypothetical protein